MGDDGYSFVFYDVLTRIVFLGEVAVVSENEFLLKGCFLWLKKIAILWT